MLHSFFSVKFLDLQYTFRCHKCILLYRKTFLFIQFGQVNCEAKLTGFDCSNRTECHHPVHNILTYYKLHRFIKQYFIYKGCIMYTSVGHVFRPLLLFITLTLKREGKGESGQHKYIMTQGRIRRWQCSSFSDQPENCADYLWSLVQKQIHMEAAVLIIGLGIGIGCRLGCPRMEGLNML